MSYPPPQHVLRDLALAVRPDDGDGTAVVEAEVRPGMLDPAGGLRLGVIATLVDVTGARIALRAVAPDWIATADLGVHLLAPVDAGSVTVTSHPLRAGRTSVVIRTEVVAGDGTLVAAGRTAFSRIPGSATTFEVDPDGDRATPPAFDGGVPLDDDVVARCGMVPVGPGALRYETAPYVLNSFGTVNGGIQALAAEAAAVHATRGRRALDLQIHYLEQAGAGPVAVTAEVVRSGEGHALCRVEALDRSDRRLLAVADVAVEV